MSERHELAVDFHVHLIIDPELLETERDRLDIGWPLQPPADQRLPDEVWARMRSEFDLPDRTQSGINVRWLLERELHHAKLSIREESLHSPVKLRARQLARIANGKAGNPMPQGLHSEIYSLLGGMMMCDPASSAFGISAAERCLHTVRRSTIISDDLTRYARDALQFGAARGARTHGGGDRIAEQAFIDVLLRLWRDTLSRAVTNWADEVVVVEGAGRRARMTKVPTGGQTTRFIAKCLELVGVRRSSDDLRWLDAIRKRIDRRIERRTN